MTDSSPEDALARIAIHLQRRGQAFALVGGLGVSIRGEVRFTRDVDLAISVSTDGETERLVRDLVADGYVAIASVEHATRGRLATVRMRSPSAVVVDLLAASSGIEAEVVARAEPVTIEGVGTVPVARAEELLALKILSMTEARSTAFWPAAARRSPAVRPIATVTPKPDDAPSPARALGRRAILAVDSGRAGGRGR